MGARRTCIAPARWPLRASDPEQCTSVGPRFQADFRLGWHAGTVSTTPTPPRPRVLVVDDDRVEVISSGTGGWHVGNPMDRRAAATLTSHGYDASRHRAQQFHPSWFDDCDVVLAMDADNLADLEDLTAEAEHHQRLLPFRALDPRADGDLDVPDPYYGADDGFEHVLGIVTRTSRALVREVQALLRG